VIASHDLAILPKMDVVYHMKSGQLVKE
jgi:hypothetical protein